MSVVPIIGRRAMTPADAVAEFLQRRAANNVDNRSRDKAIAALILVVEAMAKRDLASHPELLAQVQAHVEAAVGAGEAMPDGSSSTPDTH